MMIQRKLTLTMMSISLAAVLLTVTAITTYLIYDMRQGKREELVVTAALTGDRNSASLAFLDNDRAERNLDIFRMTPSILFACVYDRAGVLFAGYKAETVANGCPQLASELRPNPDMLTAQQPIHQNADVIGSVFVASDMREIDTYVEKIILISITVSALVMLVSLFLTMYFQRTIARPILALAATAQMITENNDYTLTAREGEPDETGLLARAFNAMIGEVHKRDQELLEANESLEHKVLQRTRELESSMRKAEAASAAKSEFLRNMSHEFRTPLHAIISFSSYGIKENATATADQLKQYFEFIQKGAERLSRLVNEVLDLAKLEQGEQMFLLKRGSINELAARVVEQAGGLLQEKSLTVCLDQPEEEAIAVCDHDKIMQVMTNLLGNAIKFTPNGKRITLKTCTSGEGADRQVLVSVIDEGVGIPEGEKEHIFESFRQSSRTNNGAGGTGLGLAICRNIIEAHQGRIWADNNDGAAGATVTFAIPAVTEEGKRKITVNTTEARHENAA